MHTPGPWLHELHVPRGSADGSWRVVDPQSDNGDVLAVVDPDDTREELGQTSEGNACLMAAAPDLLYACALALNFIDADGEDAYVAGVLRAAIDRAEGRSL